MHDALSFVGRRNALAELTGLLDRAVAGRGSLVLVAGEAGIGKTTLVERFATTAGERDVRVLWGGCWPGQGQSPYWPFVQVLRSCVADWGWDRVSGLVGGDARYLSRLLPEREAGDPGASEDESTRFRLFDTLTRVLVGRAAEKPLVVVLEDLHWADEGSLRYLEFLGHLLRQAGLLVIGTYRDVDAEDSALTERLPQLRRFGPRLDIAGLDQDEVGQLMRSITATRPDADLVTKVHRSSGGNPLFAGEVARLLGAGGSGEDVPAAVEHVIDRRLSLLGADEVALLSTAAVLGAEFDPAELADLANLAVADVRGRLSESLRRRVLIAADGDRLRFLHALLRDALYRRLDVADREALHRRAGKVILARSTDQGAVASRVAHHFSRGNGPQQAVQYDVLAGKHAMRSLAFEDAVRHFARAAAAVAEGEGPQRCEILMNLALAQWRAGNGKLAAQTYQAAFDLAKAIGDVRSLGLAALGCCVRDELWANEPKLIANLEYALDTLEDKDPALRARLLARLSRELVLVPGTEDRRAVLVAEAEQVARAVDDPATLAEVLGTMHNAHWTPDNAGDRLRTAVEIIGLAKRAGDENLVVDGALWRVVCLVELGDRVEAEKALVAYGRCAEELRGPLRLFYHRCIAAHFAFLDGRFAASEALIEEALALGERAHIEAAEHLYHQHKTSVALARGDRAETEAQLAAYARRMSQRPEFTAFGHCVSALVQAKLGKTAEPKAFLDMAMSQGAPSIAGQPLGICLLTMLSEIAYRTGAHDHAEALFEVLRPYDGCVAVGAGVVHGLVSHALGLMAMMLSRADADGYLTAAASQAKSMRARPLFARISLDHARLLAGTARGAALAAEVRDECAELGMELLHGEALGHVAPAEVTRSASLRREGEYWSLHCGQSVVRLKNTKGIGYLVRLLSRPGAELHVLDLVGEESVTQQGLPVLDAAAKSAYRARLAELRADRDEAESYNDPARVDSVQAEIDALVRELSGAVGLGGRDRRTGSSAERARLNVTRSLRTIIARITEGDPELGHHLDTTIRTGSYCEYRPGPRPPVKWTW
ncbi:AAA family ATPase [Allokutzneria sp. A3M-2-11 16]|uniref:ATP-binding protein n=1 Tax=Allokutzneria sp. A3M-2-11 16 TaxID=2962043 RepID=UPI0020B6E673|nr:AAA family ATPase [Allokutzneria sp. A3M-2-11 16]MCP3802182.1 AAA family ATPase [Allokutzneria sp. A3M-2-11 16]